MNDHSGYTLVLGGSAGIGFAFADWCAGRSHRIIIVGRSKSKLRKAQRALLVSGADEVTWISGDLMNHQFRSKLLSRLSPNRISNVFIGGPTPPVRSPSATDWRSVQEACQICIVYPVHILSSLLASESQNVHFIFLSSSAARERLENHPFFLSAVFRRTAETMLRTLVDERSNSAALSIWRPTVVYTGLAKRYARSLSGNGCSDDSLDRLKRRFAVSSVPSPSEYVDRMMRAE